MPEGCDQKIIKKQIWGFWNILAIKIWGFWNISRKKIWGFWNFYVFLRPEIQFYYDKLKWNLRATGRMPRLMLSATSFPTASATAISSTARTSIRMKRQRCCRCSWQCSCSHVLLTNIRQNYVFLEKNLAHCEKRRIFAPTQVSLIRHHTTNPCIPQWCCTDLLFSHKKVFVESYVSICTDIAFTASLRNCSFGSIQMNCLTDSIPP